MTPLSKGVWQVPTATHLGQSFTGYTITAAQIAQLTIHPPTIYTTQ